MYILEIITQEKNLLKANIRRTNSSEIVVEVKLSILLPKLILYSFAHYAYVCTLPIVEDAVVEHQLHISDEVSCAQILVAVQLRLNGSQVHGFLHYVEVVRDVQLLRVNWLIKDPSLLVFEQRIDYSLSGLVPVIIDNHVLRQFLVLDVSKHILIVRVKVPGNLWVFLLESNPLILIHGLVNSILQHCQLVSL